MGKNLGTRAGIILATLAVFVYGILYGNNLPKIASFKTLLSESIHLGLDLKGGSRLVLKVLVSDAIGSSTDRDMQALNTALAATGATATKPDPINHPEVLNVTGGTQPSDVRSILDGNEYASYDVTSGPTGGFVLTMKQAAIRDLEDRTLQTSIEVIRTRVDSLGVSEPVIEQYGGGDDQILVQLPGVSDLARVDEILHSTAKLEIHAVVPGGPFETQDAALQSLNGAVPPDDVILKGSASGTGPVEYWVLKRAAIVEGTDFRDAQPSTDENGRPNVHFYLTTEAGDRFYKYTSANVNSSMAIVLQNEVKEVATINEGIRDSGVINGGFTQQAATDLGMMLRTGALPARIITTETRSVGPSLGAASIHQGVVAAIAGMLVVMLFMLVYYRGAGINADLALFLNLIILLGFMGFSHAVLTLPGIAGVILTIGMGVDSNVLIFERVREELRLGKTSAAAIKDGFDHAWITILDTHVTTIVSAAILFIFGTGPVKGFAVTLTFGLLANIFTAVFVSRTIFDWLLSKKERGAAISI